MSNDNFFPFSDKLNVLINSNSSPPYYYFEFDTRIGNILAFPHFHSCYEILILLEGEMSGHIIDGEYYPFCKYDMVLLSPLVLHKTEYPKWFTHRRLLINFTIPKSDPAFYALAAPLVSLFEAKIPIYRFSEDNRNRLFRILNEILTLKVKNHPLIGLLVHIKLLEFLSLLYDLREQNLYTVEPHSNSSIQKVYNLTSYIHQNFTQALPLENLSQMVNTSSCYLSRIFKNVTGFSPSNYIQMTRIRHTQQLLLSTNMRITEIAEQCGFNSFSQFNRIFRKFCLCSPSVFRKKNENEGLTNSLMIRLPGSDL